MKNTYFVFPPLTGYSVNAENTQKCVSYRNGILTVIDFDRDDFGDPWEEFNRIVWSAQVAPAFASGMFDGYFGGEVPLDFWKLLALYISSNTLGSLPWAIPFGEEEIQVMRKQAEQVLQWYDGMTQVVPSWYR